MSIPKKTTVGPFPEIEQSVTFYHSAPTNFPAIKPLGKKNSMMEVRRFELLAFCMRSRRSTNWAIPPSIPASRWRGSRKTIALAQRLPAHQSLRAVDVEGKGVLSRPFGFCSLRSWQEREIEGERVYVWGWPDLNWRPLGLESNALPTELHPPKKNLRLSIVPRQVHLRGIEPRANAWKAFMLPLHQRCTKHDTTKSYHQSESNK